MGKEKKNKQHNRRHNPYDKQAKEKEDVEFEDVEDAEEQDGNDGTMDAEMQNQRSLTRGAILQRHKLELRELKRQLEQLKKSRGAIKQKDHKMKAERNALTEEMKRLKTEMEERHTLELQQFDAQNNINDPNAPTMVVPQKRGGKKKIKKRKSGIRQMILSSFSADEHVMSDQFRESVN